MTAEEVAAINGLLKQRGTVLSGAGRSVALAWGALKIAGALALAAGVIAGYSDGDPFE
jgi:hypothetical protein